MELERLKEEREYSCRGIDGILQRSSFDAWISFKGIADPMIIWELGCYMIYDPKYDIKAKEVLEWS